MELVDMRDLGSRVERRWGSSPHARTKSLRTTYRSQRLFLFKSHFSFFMNTNAFALIVYLSFGSKHGIIADRDKSSYERKKKGVCYGSN